MGHKFAELAFSAEAKALQSRYGSRDSYARMEDGPDINHILSEKEAEFIAARDSFYMASVGANGWPYVQHRGGPVGFVHVLEENTLGFADFRGNRQYVSVGNFATNDRVSLFFMDYAHRRRLKILGRAVIVPSDDVDVLARLELPDYRARVERGILIKVEAFDWNCPQHITPRFTAAEIEHASQPLHQRIAELEAEVARLKMPN